MALHYAVDIEIKKTHHVDEKTSPATEFFDFLNVFERLFHMMCVNMIVE